MNTSLKQEGRAMILVARVTGQTPLGHQGDEKNLSDLRTSEQAELQSLSYMYKPLSPFLVCVCMRVCVHVCECVCV